MLPSDWPLWMESCRQSVNAMHRRALHPLSAPAPPAGRVRRRFAILAAPREGAMRKITGVQRLLRRAGLFGGPLAAALWLALGGSGMAHDARVVLGTRDLDGAVVDDGSGAAGRHRAAAAGHPAAVHLDRLRRRLRALRQQHRVPVHGRLHARAGAAALRAAPAHRAGDAGHGGLGAAPPGRRLHAGHRAAVDVAVEHRHDDDAGPDRDQRARRPAASSAPAPTADATRRLWRGTDARHRLRGLDRRHGHPDRHAAEPHHVRLPAERTTASTSRCSSGCASACR